MPLHFIFVLCIVLTQNWGQNNKKKKFIVKYAE